jgi:hypothetical protein
MDGNNTNIFESVGWAPSQPSKYGNIYWYGWAQQVWGKYMELWNLFTGPYVRAKPKAQGLTEWHDSRGVGGVNGSEIRYAAP